MKFLSRAWLIFLYLLSAFGAEASEPLDVVINEVAWMGTKNSFNDEWIELYNNSDNLMNLDGWTLKAKDGTPEINLTGKIASKEYFLLERTDDSTVPNVPGDQFYKGSLGNQGEFLELYGNLSQLIDKADCSLGWFAGDNETKQTMERKNFNEAGSNSNAWLNSQNPQGTPKERNSVSAEPVIIPEKPKDSEKPEDLEKTNQAKEESQIEPESPVQPESSIQLEPAKSVYPSGILINEILPSPIGADDKEEWIEIFNQNNSEVELSNWQITDTIGKVSIYTFPQGTKLSSKDFLVISRQTTGIILNNDGDVIKLSQPDGKVVAEVSYEKAMSGESYNLINSSWVWSDILTPGKENKISLQPSESKKEQPLLKEENKLEKGLAAASTQSLEEKTDLFSILFYAILIAGFSAVLILAIKSKLKKFALSNKLD